MVYYVFFFVELLLLFSLSRFVTRSLSQIVYRITKNQTVTIYSLAFLFLPGTVIHELSHLITAVLLFVPVGDIEFIPEIKKNGEVKLGSVEIAHTDPLRRAVIGVAPTITGTALLMLILLYCLSTQASLLSLPLWKIALSLYAVFEIGNTMFSSRKDIEGTIELIVAIVVIVSLFYILGIRVSLAWLYDAMSRYAFFMEKTDMFLVVPIGINLIISALTKILLRSNNLH